MRFWRKTENTPPRSHLERGIDGTFKIIDLLLTLACMIGVGIIAGFLLSFSYEGFAYIALTILAAIVIGGLLRLFFNIVAWFG